MRFLSVCSGIEAASVAWHPLGWEALAFSEVEPFPRAVLAHHYPNVPCHGDFTLLRDQEWIGDAELLVGGTPCQGFSVAGLRGSLDDDRSNLCLEFIRLADAIDDLRRARGDRESIVLWENVPGVLSTKDNAFGCFLAGLVGEDSPLQPTGGRWTDAGMVDGPRRRAAWRILDAQYFGVPQRRRRVFVVADSRDGIDPAAVLFERHSLQGRSAPRCEAGTGVTGALAGVSPGGGWRVGADEEAAGFMIAFDTTQITSKVNRSNPRPGDPCHPLTENGHPPALAFGGNDTRGPIDVATALNAHGGPMGRMDFESETFIAHKLTGNGFDVSEDGTGRGTPLVPIAFSCKDHGADAGQIAPTLRAMGFSGSHANAGGQIAVVIHENQRGEITTNETAESLKVGGRKPGQGYAAAMTNAGVRRLTPTECEFLQGFPRNYTDVPYRGRPSL